MSINDMRKIWGAQWSDGYLLKVGSIGYRLEGNHLGQYIEDPNATIPEMYGNLTIRRDSLDFWDNESSIPMGPRNKILHPLCEIIEIIPNADINRISGFVG